VKVTTIILMQLQFLCNTLLIFLAKKPQRYKITTANSIATAIKVSLISPQLAVEIKCKQQTQMHSISSMCFRE